jgi:DNA repair exonuclease SbcCD nuclease subunit
VKRFLFHDPASLQNRIIEDSIQNFLALKDIPLIAISGNHDISEKNLGNNKSPSYISALAKANKSIVDVSYSGMSTADGKLVVCGVPYMHDPKVWADMVKDRNKEVKNKSYDKAFKVLLIHRDLPGCVTPQGFECKETEDLPDKLDKLWDNFDLVLAGHIHKWHRVSKKCWMLGSPIHQNRGDVGCKMGYWEIWDDGPKLRPLNKHFPCFVQLQKGEQPYNDKDYFIPYEEEVLEEDIVQGEFNVNLSKKKLVSRYFKAKGLKHKQRKRLLVNILNEAHNA